jgi:hypothetical protein
MKLPRLLSTLLLVSLATLTAATAADSGPVYELRIYTATPGNGANVIARFRDHTTKLFEKHGMVNVGYWVPMDEKDGAADKLVYLLEHKSRDAAKASWKSFSADPDWKEVVKQSQVNGKIVAKGESVFLAPTDFSKPMTVGSGKGGARVFEMRTYTAAEGKLAGLDARFRDHTLALFARHGMTNLGYFHATDADKGADKMLIYFLAHASREAAAASWKSFRDDPAWAKARTESEKAGKLTTKVEGVYLKATDFSKTK